MLQLNYDIQTGKLVDSEGGRYTRDVRIAYQSRPSWEITFVQVDSAAGTMSAVDVSGAVAWASAVAKDWTHTADPMVRVLNADIDNTDAADGKIIVTLDADTATFQAAVSGQSYIRTPFFELRGLDSSSDLIHYAKFPVIADNILDPAGGTPLGPTGNYYTKTDTDALIRAGNEVQFSEDDVTYHATQTADDRYMQYRYPGGDWSATITLVVGPTGMQGVTGPTGNIGPTGIQGVTGPQNVTGPQGIQGPTGVQGSTGVQGVNAIGDTTGAVPAFLLDNGYLSNSGATGKVIYTLPDAVPDMRGLFLASTAEIIQLAPATGDAFRGEDADDNLASGGTQGECISIACFEDNIWDIIVLNGTWAVPV